MIKYYFFISALLTLLLSGCEQASSPTNEQNTQTPIVDKQMVITADAPTQSTEIENKHYLFDVTEHSVEELQALLERISMIMEASPETFNELKIVMILHGPDIGLFTKQNYEKNKIIVDLAKKLDSIEVVDMQACETTMNSLGFSEEQLPEFIETVPYAPDTIKSLNQEGYINL